MSDKIVAYRDLTTGQIYCLECTAETLNDESFANPYNVDEVDDFDAIYENTLADYDECGIECDYCNTVIYEGE